VGRESYGLAMAVQNLAFGILSPVMGALSDRFGAVKVILVCSLVQALGMALGAAAQGALTMEAGLGLLVGIGQAGTTYTIVLGVLGQLVAPQRRSLVFGVVTAMGSFGMFAMVPVSQYAISGLGWRDGLMVLGALVGIGCAIAGFALRVPPRDKEGQSQAAAWRQAREHRGYWLLNTGFFVCGFQVTFIGVHFNSYLQDQGLTAVVAANIFALIGLFNMLGSVTFGWLGGRYRKRNVLAGIYFARAVVFTVFLLAPLSAVSATLFAILIGFLWLGTVPLTSGMVGDMFGMRYLATLYGVVFLGHQLGSFAGAWAGGLAFDLTGSYQPVWVGAVALGILAGVLHLVIDDRPVKALAPT